MTLTNTLLFSLGLAALALPLWVHLRMGRTRRRAKVSSLHLLLAAPQSSRRPRRLVNVPLFLLRCLLLLLLALAFGRWLIPLIGGNNRQAYAVVVVDVSAGMRANHAEAPVWEEARARTIGILEGLAADSRVALMPSPSGGVRPAWESPPEALRRLKGMSPGYAGNRLADDLRAAARLLEAMPADRAKLLHVVSDFQRSSLAGMDQLAVSAGIEISAAKVGPTAAPNRGVAVEVMNAGAMDIGFYGFSDGSGGEMRIDENGRAKPWMAGSASAATRLAPDEKDGAWVARTISFDDAGTGDAIAEDNAGYDCFRNPAVIPVWLVEPEPRGGSAAIYQQAGYFVRIALLPVLEDETFRTSLYKPKTLSVRKVDKIPLSAGLPRLLVIPALEAPDNALAKLAEAVVAAGGSVIFFTGPDLVADDYARRFGDLLPVTIGPEIEFGKPPTLEPISARHPLWGGLDGKSRRDLAHIGLLRGHTLEAVDGAKVLAYDAAARPFIVGRRIGNGGVYFVNTSSDRTWGDWAAKPALFVPALHQLCAHALGGDASEVRHAPWAAGRPGTLRLGKQYAGVTVNLDGRKAMADELGDLREVIFEKPGISDVTSPDGTVLERVAVNFPHGESLLDSLPEAVATQRLAARRHNGEQRAERWAADADAGSLAWKICLVLIAFLLLIEPYLIHRPRLL